MRGGDASCKESVGNQKDGTKWVIVITIVNSFYVSFTNRYFEIWFRDRLQISLLILSEFKRIN